jgi:hypothetical protein
MSVNFVWKINQLEKNVLNGIVVTIHWECTGTEEITGTSARTYGSIGLKTIDSNDPNFILFENLSEQQVLDWLMKAIHVEDYKKAIINQIEELNSPQVVITTPPWAS